VSGIKIDLSDLHAKLALIAKQQEQLAQMIAQKVALDILSGVVLGTPVDTGRARGGWMVELGGAEPSGDGSPDKGGGGAISAGASKIAAAKPFEQISIANNVPYIGRLNDGHSKQAPKEFIQKAIDRVIK